MIGPHMIRFCSVVMTRSEYERGDHATESSRTDKFQQMMRRQEVHSLSVRALVHGDIEGMLGGISGLVGQYHRRTDDQDGR